jgi:hypothetical protein
MRRALQSGRLRAEKGFGPESLAQPQSGSAKIAEIDHVQNRKTRKFCDLDG